MQGPPQSVAGSGNDRNRDHDCRDDTREPSKGADAWNADDINDCMDNPRDDEHERRSLNDRGSSPDEVPLVS